MRRVEGGLDIDELTQNYIRRAVLGRDETERRVRNAVHRGETDDRPSYVVPKIHIGHRLAYHCRMLPSNPRVNRGV